ncbi:MAG: IS200/IS605 family transposase, partial [Candidatus Hodarchaeales archaeon]
AHLLRNIAARRRLEIISLSIQPDHVHLFINADPFQLPCKIVKSFKGETAFKLFKEFPSLRLHLWKGTLWSPSY